jgi:hypothetical protein
MKQDMVQATSASAEAPIGHLSSREHDAAKLKRRAVILRVTAASMQSKARELEQRASALMEERRA